MKWAYDNNIPGLNESDVLASCEHLSLQDKLFDILNSQSKFAPEYEAALSLDNIVQMEEVFAQIAKMWSS